MVKNFPDTKSFTLTRIITFFFKTGKLSLEEIQYLSQNKVVNKRQTTSLNEVCLVPSPMLFIYKLREGWEVKGSKQRERRKKKENKKRNKMPKHITPGFSNM